MQSLPDSPPASSCSSPQPSAPTPSACCARRCLQQHLSQLLLLLLPLQGLQGLQELQELQELQCLQPQQAALKLPSLAGSLSVLLLVVVGSGSPCSSWLLALFLLLVCQRCASSCWLQHQQRLLLSCGLLCCAWLLQQTGRTQQHQQHAALQLLLGLRWLALQMWPHGQQGLDCHQ
jgi:hypothetical protein